MLWLSWLAGICVVAPQGAGVHCDNIGGVNSMLWCCRMLGAGGGPLAVYHGEVDPLIPCGEAATTETKPRSLCLSVAVARSLSLFLCTLSAVSVCVYVAVSASVPYLGCLCRS